MLTASGDRLLRQKHTEEAKEAEGSQRMNSGDGNDSFSALFFPPFSALAMAPDRYAGTECTENRRTRWDPWPAKSTAASTAKA